MLNHVATVRFRLAVAEMGYEDALSGATGTGAPQAGPQSNEVAQGTCMQDVLSGMANINNGLGAAGFAANVVATIGNAPVAVANIMAGTAGVIGSASQAFDASPACQALDNAATANTLGLGAIVAP